MRPRGSRWSCAPRSRSSASRPAISRRITRLDLVRIEKPADLLRTCRLGGPLGLYAPVSNPVFSRAFGVTLSCGTLAHFVQINDFAHRGTHGLDAPHWRFACPHQRADSEHYDG